MTVERVGVYCNDCDSLLKEVLSVREMNPHETTVLVGLDDGQGLLKVCMTVQLNKTDGIDNFEPDENRSDMARSSYSEGVFPKDFKYSSVKKLLILAAWPDVPEAYSNLQQILELLNLHALQFSISADIKMLLLLCGKPTEKPKLQSTDCLF